MACYFFYDNHTVELYGALIMLDADFSSYLSIVSLALIIISIFLFIFILYSFLQEYLGIKSYKKPKFKKIKNMPMSEYFKDMYKFLESKYSINLEKQRKKIIISIGISSMFVVIVIILTILFVYKIGIINSNIIGYAMFFPLLFVFYAYSVYKKYNKIYKEYFKDNIIKNFVEYTNHNNTYLKYGGTHLFPCYLEAKFNDDSYDKFATDDYIETENDDGANFQLCNISLQDVDRDRRNIKNKI